MQRISPGLPWPLHDSRSTRELESRSAAALPGHTLMQRAGLASARLALALAPHARTYWFMCGPGNNGGDGLEAAAWLRQWGHDAQVTLLAPAGEAGAPPDAAHALERARASAVVFSADRPTLATQDLCIDALLGLGQRGPTRPALAHAAALMHGLPCPILSLDVPTGLCSDTGRDLNHGAARSAATVCAQHTLSLLTLKPGLFTGAGRHFAGQVWFDDLGVLAPDGSCSARLVPCSAAIAAPHTAHKGSRGSVWIVGGAAGMRGAAQLAARAALHAGAGKVHVQWIDGGQAAEDPLQPELLYPGSAARPTPAMAVLCGCGGGEPTASVLPAVLAHAGPVVLDADALNAVARDTALQTLLRARGARQRATVLTPHPLEAARLLGTTLQEVQADRLAAARELAHRHACVAVLKGSGSIVAAPGHAACWINPTGNGRLAQAGTGDVLAGMLVAELALGRSAEDAACRAVYRHGLVADQSAGDGALCASRVALGPDAPGPSACP